MAFSVTAIMLLVLVFPSSVLPFQSQQLQQAQATTTTSSSSSSDDIPPAYIIVDGKASKLQLENGIIQVSDDQKRLADYSRHPQGTISFGEDFELLVPQVPDVYKDVNSTTLWINTDKANANDGFHVRVEGVKVKDTSYIYRETYVINAPSGLGYGETASDKGSKVFLWWDVSFTDGTSQIYVAIVTLKGDPCQEHGWIYDPTNDERCKDPTF